MDLNKEDLSPTPREVAFSGTATIFGLGFIVTIIHIVAEWGLATLLVPIYSALAGIIWFLVVEFAALLYRVTKWEWLYYTIIVCAGVITLLGFAAFIFDDHNGW